MVFIARHARVFSHREQALLRNGVSQGAFLQAVIGSNISDVVILYSSSSPHFATLNMGSYNSLYSYYITYDFFREDYSSISSKSKNSNLV